MAYFLYVAVRLIALTRVTPRLACVAWRATAHCDPHGGHLPLEDGDCDAVISPQSSGYCLCRVIDPAVLRSDVNKQGVRTSEVHCDHPTFTCRDQCHLFDAHFTGTWDAYHAKHRHAERESGNVRSTAAGLSSTEPMARIQFQCTGWLQTGGCRWDGVRELAQDRSAARGGCNQLITAAKSGSNSTKHSASPA